MVLRIVTNDDLASIIIPTHYRNDRLRDAIESALAQTYDPIETIVVDDSGERHAENVATSYDVTYVPHSKNRGGNPARNTGIDLNVGAYIQLLDDDDVLYRDKLEKQIELLESNPKLGVAYGGIETSRGAILPERALREPDLHRALKFDWSTAITSSLLISREPLKEVYPLTARPAADDVGMKIELAKRTKFGYVDDVLVKLGNTPNNRSSTLEFSKELENIMDEYDDLYRQLPDEVRRGALSTLYECRGYNYLNERQWSAEAVVAMAKACYYSDEIDAKLVGGLVASMFGQPGRRIASRLYTVLSQTPRSFDNHVG